MLKHYFLEVLWYRMPWHMWEDTTEIKIERDSVD
jgi:hypothetical protein